MKVCVQMFGCVCVYGFFVVLLTKLSIFGINLTLIDRYRWTFDDQFDLSVIWSDVYCVCVCVYY